MAMLPSILFFRLLCAISPVQSHIFRLNQVNADTLNAISEIQHPGSAIAQIHDAVPNVRSPIIDPDNDPLAVFQVRHFYESSQWKLPVSGSELEHVKVFTACCGSTVELLAIPGGGSNLIGFLFSL